VVDVRDKITRLFSSLYNLEVEEDQVFDENELKEFLRKASKIAPEAVKTRSELSCLHSILDNRQK
jgi:hypothetical protein